jgi:hypothetical protein
MEVSIGPRLWHDDQGHTLAIECRLCPYSVRYDPLQPFTPDEVQLEMVMWRTHMRAEHPENFTTLEHGIQRAIECKTLDRMYRPPTE